MNSNSVVSFDWLNDKQDILNITIHRELDWQEYRAVCRQANYLVTAQTHRVDVIMIVEPSTSIVPPGGAMKQFAQTLDEQPCNYGTHIFVGESALLRTTIQVFLKATDNLVAQPMRFAESVHEAKHIIAKLRQSQAHS